jgi:hypothetical protein
MAHFHGAALWHDACNLLSIAQAGKSRTREKEMTNKSSVKKGTKLGGVKPLKSGLLGKVTTLKKVSPLKRP